MTVRCLHMFRINRKCIYYKKPAGLWLYLYDFIFNPKSTPMKNLLILVVIVTFLVSCSPSVTMHQAANSNYKGTRSVR